MRIHFFSLKIDFASISIDSKHGVGLKQSFLSPFVVLVEDIILFVKLKLSGQFLISNAGAVMAFFPQLLYFQTFLRVEVESHEIF